MSSPSGVTRKLKAFKYCWPTSVEEAVAILEEYDGRAKVIAGGTDLLPMMKLRAVTPECVISLKRMVELDYVREEQKELRIGSLTRISTLLSSDLIKQKFLSLYEAAEWFATPQVRNMATIGGNICRSSPSADMIPPLMSLGAALKLVGAKGKRRVLIEDFFTGAGQNILDHEVLSEIMVPLPEGQYGTAFTKLTRNSADLAKVNCAAKITVSGGVIDDIRIVLGAVADRPVRAKRVEIALKGREIKDEVIDEAARKVVEDITPITDARSTAEYRAQVSQVLTKRVIMRALDMTD